MRRQKTVSIVILAILLITGVTILLLGHFTASNKTPGQSRAVVIGYQQIALYRHLFTAKAKGYFDEERVNVEIKPFVSANQMIQAMIAGDLDATGLSNMQVALTIEGKDPDLFELVNFLIWREKSYPDYILARKDVGIKALKDFEGKAMGLHPGSAVRAFSKTVLEVEGIDLNKVKFLELKPPMMKDAILAKRVDGLYCMDPVATILVQKGSCDVILANPMQRIFPAPVPISGTAISKNLLKEAPEAARGVVRALERAIKYMREPGHEDEIASYIARYTPITKELAMKMNVSEYWALDEIDRDQAQKLADRFHEMGIVEKWINVNDIIVNEDFLLRSK